MSLYVAYHPDRPGRLAFWSQHLDDVANAVAIQHDADVYAVRRHHSGAALYLDDDEQAALDTILAGART